MSMITLVAARIAAAALLLVFMGCGEKGNPQDAVVGQLFRAASTGKTTKVKELVGRGAPVDALNKQGQTVLQVAARYSQADVVQSLLLAGADPNQPSSGGYYAILAAVNSNSEDAVQHLIRHQVDVNVTWQGRTPLTLAAFAGNDKIVALLLRAGADVNAKGRLGVTALGMTESSLVAAMLLNAGADPNARTDDGQTPLHSFVAVGDPKLVRLLLEHGAKPNIADHDGNTPLHDLVKQFGTQDEDIAIDVAELLLRAGADSSLPNRAGVSAAKLAKTLGYRPLVALFRKH